MIGSGVTKLTYHVFAEYKELQAVEIPESVTAILDGAFRGCVSLTSVTVPAGVVFLSTGQEEGERVYWGAFGGCVSLREADIAARDIGPRAFTGCSSLARVTLREGVETIGDEAFLNCALTGLELPASLKSIGVRAVGGNPQLKSVSVAAGNAAYKSVDGVVFRKDGTALTLFPPGKSGAYDIPDSVERIEDAAFYQCRGLTGIGVPEGTTAIGNEAFARCDALLEAPFPGSLRSVGDHAFDGCAKLARLELGGAESIGERAFCGCRALTAVTLPGGLRSAGESAFAECLGLSSVTIPGSLKTVPKNLFGSCLNLGSVTLEDGVEEIGDSAFPSSRLRIAVLPRSVRRVGTKAFAGTNAYGDSPKAAVHYAGTREEWERIEMGETPFGDGASIRYESGGPDGPVLLSASVGVRNDPSGDSLRLILTPRLNNIGPAGEITVCAAYYEGGRMVGFREARLRAEPGERTYSMDPLVFEGLTASMVEHSRVFLLDGGRAPLAKTA